MIESELALEVAQIESLSPAKKGLDRLFRKILKKKK